MNAAWHTSKWPHISVSKGEKPLTDFWMTTLLIASSATVKFFSFCKYQDIQIFLISIFFYKMNPLRCLWWRSDHRDKLFFTEMMEVLKGFPVPVTIIYSTWHFMTSHTSISFPSIVWIFSIFCGMGLLLWFTMTLGNFLCTTSRYVVLSRLSSY